MKGRLALRIKKMEKDGQWVHVHLEGEGQVTQEGLGKDAKSSGGEMILRVKPLAGDQIKLGDRIYLHWTTDEQAARDVHES
jgi:hypothetical protein